MNFEFQANKCNFAAMFKNCNTGRLSTIRTALALVLVLCVLLVPISEIFHTHSNTTNISGTVKNESPQLKHASCEVCQFFKIFHAQSINLHNPTNNQLFFDEISVSFVPFKKNYGFITSIQKGNKGPPFSDQLA